MVLILVNYANLECLSVHSAYFRDNRSNYEIRYQDVIKFYLSWSKSKLKFMCIYYNLNNNTF